MVMAARAIKYIFLILYDSSYAFPQQNNFEYNKKAYNIYDKTIHPLFNTAFPFIPNL
jgi:hypothetical protein